MPIYEFYCKNCHTIYKFFSRTVNTEKIPACPKCGNPALEKRVSMFAFISGKKEESETEPGMPDIDEAKLEKAMAALAREADRIDEDNPRQAADLMRRLSEATGLKLGPGMEEALARMEKGEDPEKIEEEMGDMLNEDDLFVLKEKARGGRNESRPQVDEHLYDM